MKKILQKLLAIVLCVTLFGETGSVVIHAAEESSVKQSIEEFLSEENNKVIFDKMVNVLIDIVHTLITAYRYPWKAKGNSVDMSKFTMTFDEEFDEDTLNTDIWWNYADGIRKGGYWDPAQSFVKDGNLIIRTEYKENGTYGPGYYNRRVDTRGRFEQTYGYFECRCILPAAEGLWSAFWLSSTKLGDGVPGEQGTEIDVFESPLWYRGKMGLENNLVSSNLHYGGYSLGHHYTNVAVSKANNPYKEYNTYGVEWNQNEYIFYINGVETGRSSYGGVSKVPEYLELSAEVDGVGGKPFYGWSGIITNNKAGELPADFIVDYVRAYQYTDLMPSAK